MGKVYKLTSTLNGFIPEVEFTESKEDAEFIVVGGKAFNLAEFPKLKGVFKTGVGTDNLPFEEAAKRGIKIELPQESTRDIIFEETANFTCYLILKGAYLDYGDWASWKKANRTILNRHKLLLIGQGRIGSKVKTKMDRLMDVDTFDILTNAKEELDYKMAVADCVSIHLPLNDDTRGMFNANLLAKLKNGALLVNTSRGPIVDEEALKNELDSERIRAAFDVFWKEPYEGSLADLPEDRFIKSPHVASTCKEFLEETAKDFINFMKSFKE